MGKSRKPKPLKMKPIKILPVKGDKKKLAVAGLI